MSPRLAALAILAVSAWLVWAAVPVRGTVQEGKQATRAGAAVQVPAQLGLWTGKPLAVAPRSVEILETDDVTLMEYQLGQEPPLWFAQVGGFGGRAAFHPPELCYVGSHFEVLERGPIMVMINGGKTRRIMRLVLGQGSERFEAWYWFTANGRVTPNYYQQQVWLLGDLIRRRPVAGTLVRISTPVDDPERARRRLLAFVSSWDRIEGERSHGT
jgi:EpsI family protein